MNHFRRNISSEEGGEEWRIAYIDLLTNVLIFFVMAFSLSIADVEKLKMFSEYFVKKKPTEVKTYPQPDVGEVPIDVPGSIRKQSTVIPLFQEIKELAQIQGIQVAQREEGVALILSDQLLFESGQTTVKPNAAPILGRVSSLLKRTNFNMRIEGHTDNTQMSSSRYPTNWELSTARAASVAEFLVRREGIKPQRLSLSGYGEYKPLAPNITPEGRAKNRRVELILLGAKL